MPPHKCSYFMCTNTSEIKSMFRFPWNNASRLKAWLDNSGNMTIINLPPERLRSRYLCADHFNKKYIHNVDGERKRLTKAAIPELCQTSELEPSCSLSSGNMTIINLPPQRRIRSRYLCDDHFDKKYIHNVDGERKKLTKEAIPELCQTPELEPSCTPSSDQKMIKATNTERLNITDPLEDDTKQWDHDILSENNVICTEVEYLEEDSVSDRSDNATNKLRDQRHQTQDTDTPSKALHEQNFKLTLDEIDFLFLSYAKTFRTLAKQCQIMLKLDIAKLFARYELKNTSLSTPEASKPVEQPVPIVKPPLLSAKTPPPGVKPPPEQSIFITSKEENKTIFRRVPLQAVISDVHRADSIKSDSQVIQRSSQDEQESPQIIPQSPQVIPQSSQVIQQNPEVIQKSPQVTQNSKVISQEKIPLQKNNIQNCALFEDIPRRFGPILKFKSLQQNPPEASEIAPPPPKKMKYYLPKKGPAYAIVSKDSLQTQKESHDPDLGTDVLEPVPTETVFVTTDHDTFSEHET